MVFRHVKALRGLCNRFNPNIEIIQGESGSQSKRWQRCNEKGAWTPHKQAKQLLRHLMADLMTEVKFTSYFSCMDMIEALNGTVGDLVSYLDYGYFGVLGADLTHRDVLLETIRQNRHITHCKQFPLFSLRMFKGGFADYTMA